MKIGFYCESPADRAAMAVFVEALLGAPLEPISMDLEAHSMPGFLSALGGVYRGVHYNSDADALVIVGDCDDTEMHSSSHDVEGGASQNCRLCAARHVIGRARAQLKPRIGKPALKVAIGMAVPAAEAWYLVGRNPHVGEAQWVVGVRESRLPFTRPKLKELVYGTNRPSLELETSRAVEEAHRVSKDIQALERAFPAGFGPMALEIKSWRTLNPKPAESMPSKS